MRNKTLFIWNAAIILWSTEIFSNQFKLTANKLSFLKARDITWRKEHLWSFLIGDVIEEYKWIHQCRNDSEIWNFAHLSLTPPSFYHLRIQIWELKMQFTWFLLPPLETGSKWCFVMLQLSFSIVRFSLQWLCYTGSQAWISELGLEPNIELLWHSSLSSEWCWMSGHSNISESMAFFYS